ncbi:MAG: SagB/ThcOx family dehydrogenase [Gammaproteobacteria bacterium]|nr:SagB/ThcOx family dehydrogenase [Gammaproteobacteria bacterium]
MAGLYINQHLFFLLEEGQVLVWNYLKHEQFLLNSAYFTELLHISETGTFNDSSIMEELRNAELITETPPEKTPWGWDIISKIFHKGTQDIYATNGATSPEEVAQRYLDESTKLAATQPPPLFLEKPGKRIILPTPDTRQLDKVSLISALKNRKTSRNFDGRPITLEELSTMLYTSFGLIHGLEWEELTALNYKTIGYRKASPASGALHAEEAYIIAYQVTGLEQGIYHYRPQDHQLTLLSKGNYEAEIIQANYHQHHSKGLACGIYLTCRCDKLWWKYKHSRSLKAALLDIGHASQTFLLTATALQLKTWITAAFQDSIVSQLLQVDGTIESAFLFIGAGHGTNQPLPEAFLHL